MWDIWAVLGMLNELLIVHLSVVTRQLVRAILGAHGTIWTRTLVLEAMSQALHIALEAMTTIHVSVHTTLDDVLARMVLVLVLQTVQ